MDLDGIVGDIVEHVEGSDEAAAQKPQQSRFKAGRRREPVPAVPRETDEQVDIYNEEGLPDLSRLNEEQILKLQEELRQKLPEQLQKRLAHRPYTNYTLPDGGALHHTYFPNEEATPPALHFTRSIQPEEQTYTDGTLTPLTLRFDLRGHAVLPAQASTLGQDLGLHHHADAPDAAGYTIPELVHLCHSAVAAQRTIAVTALGRICTNHQKQTALLNVMRDENMHIVMAALANDRHITVRVAAEKALLEWHEAGGADVLDIE